MLPRPRAEIASSLTRDGVTAFLAELGGGFVEAEITSTVTSASENSTEASEPMASARLQIGDRVHVRLAGLQFSDLAGFAKLMAVDRAPTAAKPYVEPFLDKTRVLDRLAGSLDLAYGLLRANLDFQSVIVRMEETTEGLEWVDQGESLPAPMKSFTHRHQLVDTSEGCLMVDEIEVEVSPSALAPAIEFMLRAHLEHRARVYAKLFKANEAPEHEEK